MGRKKRGKGARKGAKPPENAVEEQVKASEAVTGGSSEAKERELRHEYEEVRPKG
jgi:hypothetical protein